MSKQQTELSDLWMMRWEMEQYAGHSRLSPVLFLFVFPALVVGAVVLACVGSVCAAQPVLMPLMLIVAMGVEQWRSARRLKRWRALHTAYTEERDGRLGACPAWMQRWVWNRAPYQIDEAMLSAIECHECHLPGDCPLCGAQ